MARPTFADRLEQRRPALLGAAIVGYPVAFWLVALLTPADPRTVSAIGVAVIAWLGGLRVGLVAGVGLAFCNGMIDGLIRQPDPAALIRERFPILVGWLALASIVGHFSDQARRQQAERHRTEALLSRSESRYRSVVESVGEIIYQIDADGRWTYLNPAWAAITGFDLAATLGRHSYDFVEPERRDAARASIRALLDHPDDPAFAALREARFRTADGRYRWLEVHRRPLRDEAGRAIGLTGTMRDITDRKEADEALRRSEEQLRAIVAFSAVGITVVETSGRIVEANPAFCALLGRTRDEFRGLTFAAITHPDDRDRNLECHAAMLRGERDYYQLEKRYLHRDGRDVWGRITVSPMRDAAGAISATIGVVEDITERKLAEEGLRESEERLRTVVMNAPIALFAADRRGTLTLAEGQGIARLGLPPGGVVGRALDEVFATAPAVPEQFRRALGGATFTALAELAGLAFEVSYVPIRDAGGAVAGVIGVATDITSRVAYEAQLVHQAHHDPLTDLPNRLHFTERLERALRDAHDDGGAVALLFLDLDRFKVVNDSLGHDRGDQLLIAVAGRLREGVRPGDTVARLGGDEFTVLLDGPCGEGEAVAVAGRIVEQFRQPFDLGGQQVFVSASVGVVLGQPGEGTTDLLRYADLAMYQAKAAGKARYAIFDRRLDAAALARLELEADLRQALGRGELALAYQPQIALGDGTVAGVEALLRWHHPARGLVPLADFLPLAEETGVILEIGRWVLREACGQLARWRRSDPARAPRAIGVNLSAKQFADPALVADLATALRATGLPPACLTLEIGETVAMGEATATRGTLRALRDLGVGLAIDDFGSGYSSLGSLKRFPVDTLKIDAGFVAGLGRIAEDDAIVAAVVALGHGLGLRVCAEGVETAAQLAHLRRLGCDLAQGYYFARPLAASALEALLAEIAPFDLGDERPATIAARPQPTLPLAAARD